jgi:hypothetical protein
MKIDINFLKTYYRTNFFKPFFILAVIIFILGSISIIRQPYVVKVKDEQHTYVPKVLDEYLRNNVQETKQDYMYRDDLSGFSKKKNAEIISGKFVYDTNNDERMTIKWHLSGDNGVIDEVSSTHR